MKEAPCYEEEGNSIRKEGDDQVDVMEMEEMVDFLMWKKMLIRQMPYCCPSRSCQSIFMNVK
jgi:hypothetical protein